MSLKINGLFNLSKSKKTKHIVYRLIKFRLFFKDKKIYFFIDFDILLYWIEDSHLLYWIEYSQSIKQLKDYFNKIYNQIPTQ